MLHLFVRVIGKDKKASRLEEAFSANLIFIYRIITLQT